MVAVSANIQTFVDIHTFAYDAARSRQQRANAIHDTTIGPFAGVYGRCFAGLAAFAQLDLVAAQRLYAEALTLARGSAGQHSHAARLVGALMGRLYYERGDIDEAEKLLEECHELGAESGVADFMIATYTTLPRIKALRGDIDDALSLLEEGDQAAQQLSLPRLSAAVDYERLRLHLAVSDIARAQDLLTRRTENMAPGNDGMSMAIRHYQLRMQARILCAHEEYNAAGESLAKIAQECRAVRWRYAENSAAVELAVVLSLGGSTDAALQCVVPALLAGTRSGLARMFIDAGPKL